MIGIASPANHDWLAAHGVRPVAYGEGLADRLREPRIDAFIDAHGDGYVKLAIELGVAPERINTIIDFAAVREHGVKFEGTEDARNAAVLAELPAWSPPVSWKCRSPPHFRWTTSARRSNSWSRATPEGRSPAALTAHRGVAFGLDGIAVGNLP